MHGDVYLKRDVVRFDDELTLILHIKERSKSKVRFCKNESR